MLILLLGKSSISCRFLHGMGMYGHTVDFARFSALFFQPESPENRAHCVDINSLGR
jgi:hypothetical protein